MENLKYLVDKSGDSILEEYSYSEGNLTLVINITELNRKYKIQLRTDDLSFNNYYLEKKEELYRTCRIEIQDLINVLSSKNGYYVPSDNFGKFKNESKYNLAYGKKILEIKYIFSLIGYDTLVCCLLSDLQFIDIKRID